MSTEEKRASAKEKVQGVAKDTAVIDEPKPRAKTLDEMGIVERCWTNFKRGVIGNKMVAYPVLEEKSTENYSEFSGETLDKIIKLRETVEKEGLLDEIIDGIQLGLITCCLLTFVFIALLAGSFPKFFPVVQPLYDILYGAPWFIITLPQNLLHLLVNAPKTPQEMYILMSEVLASLREGLESFPYKSFVLWFSWVAYIWETYLEIRQRSRLHAADRPFSIRGFVDAQTFLEAAWYGLDKSTLELVSSLIGQIQGTLILHYDLLSVLWTGAGSAMETYLGLGVEYEITQSILFFMASSLISLVLSLPISWYSTFVVEQRHGFNKQTPSLFISDTLKSCALVAVIGCPIMAAFLWIIKLSGSHFYLYIWLFMVGVQLVMMTLYPTVIQPLFNKFEPLPVGELRDGIEALAARLQFPLKKLYVMDGSKRSGHSNAYMYGFFNNKRIVLFDTLVEGSTIEEVCAVLGHELGHWKLKHVLKMLITGQIQLFAIFLMFSQFVTQKSMYSAFGFSTQPALIGFLLFQYLYQPVDMVLSFLMNVVSRKNEFEADQFSKSLGYAESLRSGLIKLQLENKGNMNPDPIYSAFHYSHPPLVERLDALGIQPEKKTN